MNPVYIIDNSNFCYKFKDVHKYAHIDVNGVPVSTAVLTGYIRAIRSNIFDNIIIVLDGVPKRSLELLPSYKGQRMHDDTPGLSIPKLEVVQFLSACGDLFHKKVKVVCSPGQEADQVISSLVHIISNNLPPRHTIFGSLNCCALGDDRMLRYLSTPQTLFSPFSDKYDQIIIGSTDADMAQLQRFPQVMIDQSTSGKKVVGSKTTDSVAFVRPELIPLYKAVYGDVSDNVPSLSIESKKSDVLKYIDSMFKTFDDVVKFVDAVKTDVPPPQKELFNLVRPFRKEFLRNYDVTCLQFYSVPSVVTFESYDIEKTISKYKLRI